MSNQQCPASSLEFWKEVDDYIHNDQEPKVTITCDDKNVKFAEHALIDNKLSLVVPAFLVAETMSYSGKSVVHDFETFKVSYTLKNVQLMTYKASTKIFTVIYDVENFKVLHLYL